MTRPNPLIAAAPPGRRHARPSGVRALWLSVLLLAVLAGAAGCRAEPTPYQPLADAGGYEETQLGERLWRVTFRANRYTPEERIVDFLYRRAAELTRDQGYTHFVIENRRPPRPETQQDTSGDVRVGFGFFSGGGGSAFRLGIGTSTGGGGRRGPLLGAFQVRLLTAGEAGSYEESYDAAEILQRLGPAAASDDQPSS